MENDRILIVDDDETILSLIELVLRRSGYHADTAIDGFAALGLVRSAGPGGYAVMVTDLFMPGMSGLELTAEARKVDPFMEVIVITAGASLESAIAALREGGAFDYLIKPFELKSQLTMAVQRAVVHRRLVLEKKNLQEKIAEDARQLQAVVNSTGDAILAAGPDEIIHTANPAAIRLCGGTEVIGRRWADCLPAPLLALLPAAGASGRRMPGLVEVKIENCIYNVRVAPFASDGGWLLVVRDITHLKQLDQLRTEMLVETARRIHIPLAQAMNHLVNLKLYTQHDDGITDLVYHLAQDWGRIQEWADSMLSLAQVDSQASPSFAHVNLRTILAELEERRSTELRERMDIRLKVEIPAPLPEVRADKELLSRLISVLISRAAGRSHAGDSVYLCAESNPGQVAILVQDQGPPVSEIEMPDLFEKSFIPSNGRFGTTGLELAMARSIADRLGGQIWIGSQEPRGGSITVYLPAG